MAHLSSTIHGTSFHVQDPSRADSVVPYGWGLAITGFREDRLAGPWLWVHAAIPTVAFWYWSVNTRNEQVEEDLPVKLSEVYVGFDTSGGSEFHVANLHVWAAGRRIAHFDGLHERGPELRRKFDDALPVTGAAINLSIGIEQPRLIAVPHPAPTFVFNEASANFFVDETT
jgi:hypothetical protein